MNEEIMTLVGGILIGCCISGYGAMCAGGNFLWGFCFGPFGIIVAAINTQGARTRLHIEAATAALTPPKPKKGGPLPPPKSITLDCPTCSSKLEDIPGPGTYECPDCGGYIEVR